jgi:hypothetical protein
VLVENDACELAAFPYALYDAEAASNDAHTKQLYSDPHID